MKNLAVAVLFIGASVTSSILAIIPSNADAAPGDFTWSQSPTNLSGDSMAWHAVATSSDATKLAAVVENGYVYTSADSGASWTERTAAGYRLWGGISGSSDGSRLAAVSRNGSSGAVYTSTDSGASWTERTLPGAAPYIHVSADGMHIVTMSDQVGGAVYVSDDFGVTWSTASTLPGSNQWRGLVASADNTKLLAIPFGTDYLYTSADSGETWVQQTDSGSRSWYRAASSADGTKLVA